MSVIRIEKDGNYTCMSNYHLRDNSLSLKAIGLLSKMLSLPPDWDYTVAGLAKICKDGKDAVRSALQELEAAGYMQREQTHNAAGHFSKVDYVIYEQPPLSGNPSTVKPSTVPPLTENPMQLNIDITNNLGNKPPTSPTGGKRGKKTQKSGPEWMPERFDAFWNAYPRGEKKQAAVAAWDKLHADEGLLNLMATGLKRQLESEEWQRGIGIPYASTWLNQRRWEDEVKNIPAHTQTGSSWADDPEVI